MELPALMYVSEVTLGPRRITPVTEATNARKSVAFSDLIASKPAFRKPFQSSDQWFGLKLEIIVAAVLPGTKFSRIRHLSLLPNLNHGQDTRANRTRHTTSSSTQSHAEQQHTNATQTHLTFTRTHTYPSRQPPHSLSHPHARAHPPGEPSPASFIVSLDRARRARAPRRAPCSTECYRRLPPTFVISFYFSQTAASKIDLLNFPRPTSKE